MRATVRLALATGVVAASTALAAPALAATNPYPLPSSGGGAVSTTEATPGQAITFTAGGFKPFSTVTVTVHSQVRTFTTTADAAGRISLTFTMDQIGSHTINATGVDPSGAAHVVTSSFTVAAATNAAVSTATQSSGSGLPFTGLDAAGVVALGVGIGGAGVAVRVAGRRRKAQV